MSASSAPSQVVPSVPLAPVFVRMMRADFVTLLLNDQARAEYPHATARRLALDLAALGGMAGAW